MEGLKRFLRDMFMAPEGDRYDIHAVVGYGIVVMGALLFLAGYIWSMRTGKTFDGGGFATGLAGITTSLVGVAGGMWIHSKRTINAPAGDAPPAPVTPGDIRSGNWLYIDEVGWMQQTVGDPAPKSEYWRSINDVLIPPGYTVDEAKAGIMKEVVMHRKPKKKIADPPPVPAPKVGP